MLGPMQIAIDFEKLGTATAAATRTLRQKLERVGLTVVDIASDGKTRRVAGQGYREVTVTFTDNQTVVLRVKSTGDVYQLLVNGKLTPVFAQGSADESAQELALILDKSRAALQKRLAAIKVLPPEGAKTAAPRMQAVLEQQVQQVEQAIAEAEAELAELKAA
jgi:hypothetical protein